jgi:hypothetical protein
MVRDLLLLVRIDEVTFETCPLLATSRTGVLSGLVNGVLAGTGALNFRNRSLPLSASCNRGVFFGWLYQYSDGSRKWDLVSVARALMAEESRTRASPGWN